jgi:hypothetical protein
MTRIARERGWHAEQLDDYSILSWMYANDRLRRFKPASSTLNGFDIVDATVLDEALAILRQRVDFALTRTLDRTNLVTIEFARDTYRTPLEQFGSEFLRKSYFLFLDTDIDTCMTRITLRAQHPIYEGDHFISHETMQKFYSSDDIPATRAMLTTVYGIDERHMRVIYNISSQEAFLSEVYLFVERIIRQEAGSCTIEQ